MPIDKRFLVAFGFVSISFLVRSFRFVRSFASLKLLKRLPAKGREDEGHFISAVVSLSGSKPKKGEALVE